MSIQNQLSSLFDTGMSLSKKLRKLEPKVNNKAYKTAMAKTNLLQQQKNAQRVALMANTQTSLGSFGALDPKLQALITKQMEAGNGQK